MRNLSFPQVPHRLLTFQLIPGVEVCVICGPSPPLSDLEREVRSGFAKFAIIYVALFLVHSGIRYIFELPPNIRDSMYIVLYLCYMHVDNVDMYAY